MFENKKSGLVRGTENETKQTFEEIKRDAQGMARTVEKAGQDAAKGMADMGSGGE